MTSSADAFERFMQHMPFEGELSLAVLKAHLLVEEQLWAVISERLRLQEDLLSRFKNAFQSSSHVALITEALVSGDDITFHDTDWIWGAVGKMNSLRNRMAHDLEPVGVDNKMKDIADCALEAHERTDLRTDFYLAVFKMCTLLANLRKPVDPSDFDDAF